MPPRSSRSALHWASTSVCRSDNRPDSSASRPGSELANDSRKASNFVTGAADTLQTAEMFVALPFQLLAVLVLTRPVPEVLGVGCAASRQQSVEISNATCFRRSSCRSNR